jgi:hypothetical protein
MLLWRGIRPAAGVSAGRGEAVAERLKGVHRQTKRLKDEETEGAR